MVKPTVPLRSQSRNTNKPRDPECFLQSDQQPNAQRVSSWDANGCQCMRPFLVQLDGGECALAAVKATSQATNPVCAILILYSNILYPRATGQVTCK